MTKGLDLPGLRVWLVVGVVLAITLCLRETATATSGMLHTYRTGIDLGDDPSTGCGFSLGSTAPGLLPGFDLQLTVVVNAEPVPPQVVSAKVETCDGVAFGDPQPLPGFELEVNSGLGGSDSVVGAIPCSLLNEARKMRLAYHAESFDGSEDALFTRDGSDDGSPIVAVINRPAPAPALSVFGIGLSVILLVGVGFLRWRRTGWSVVAMLAVLLIGSGAVIVYATFSDPIAVDDPSDTVPPDSRAEIVAAFAMTTGCPLGLRLDIEDIVFVAKSGDWPFFGRDLHNSHVAKPVANGISPANVDQLQVRWVYQTTPDIPVDPLFPLTVGDVTVPPAVVDGTLYFPDWAGNLHAVDAATGAGIWKKFLPLDYSAPGRFMFFSRNTPAVQGDTLVIGSDKHLMIPTCPVGAPACIPNDGAIVAAIDRQTGDLLWSTNVDTHPAAKITSSPVIRGRVVIVGVSSWEENFAINSSAAQFGGDPTDPYPCCSFRGSVVALDLQTGAILWQTFLVPGAGVPDGILATGDVGFFGAAADGGSASVDQQRRQIYVGTSNNYVVPEKARQSERNRLDPDNEPLPTLPAGVDCDNLNDVVGNYADSIVALDLDTGAVNWAFRARSYDTWVQSCAVPDFSLIFFPPLLGTATTVPPGNFASCSDVPGPDFGFAQPPMLMRSVLMPDNTRRDLLGAGEKSGVFYAIDPDTGNLVWSTRVSPGGNFGGMMWGSTNDGARVYTASGNSNNASRDRTLPFYSSPLNPIYPGFPGFLNAETEFSGPGFGTGLGGNPWTLVNPPASAVAAADGISTFLSGPDLQTITGYWSALSAATGEILWQSPLPTDGRPPVDETPEPDPSGGYVHGSLSLVNGVLFGGGIDGEGSMFAIDAGTGEILFEFNAQFLGAPAGGIEASPSIVDDVVYWGSGASRGGVWSPDFFQAQTGIPFTLGGLELRNNKVYAFELP